MPALPPGPLFAPLQMFLYMRDPVGYLARCQRRYGDPFFAPTLAGPSVATGDPEAIRVLLTLDPDTFVPAAELFKPLLGETSIVVVDPERNRSLRKLLMPPMHGPRLRQYGQTMQTISRAAASRWQMDRPFSMLKETQEITMTIIMHTIFGVTDGARMRFLQEAIKDRVNAFKPQLLFFKQLRREFGGFGAWARFVRLTRRMDAFLDAEMQRRRTEERSQEDVFSLLLGAEYDDGSKLTDQELRENLFTLLLAGFGTTASALAWAFYWLHRHPRSLDALRTELDALGADPDPDAVERLPYLTAVCNETLRISPPVLQFGRILHRDVDFKAYRFPAGTTVTGCAPLVHSREDLYPDPQNFKPERFLRRSYAPHEFLVFGGGSRRCLGAAFAMYEMKQVLFTVLSRCQLRLVDSAGERSVMRGGTMEPERGVMMQVVDR